MTEEGIGIEPFGARCPGTAFKTALPMALPSFVVTWSRMQDSNPLHLVTRQALFLLS